MKKSRRAVLTRKRRRAEKRIDLWGAKAKRKHTRPGGRTGMVMAKRSRGRLAIASAWIENPPFSGWGTR